MGKTYTPNLDLALQQDKSDQLDWDAITANWLKIDEAYGGGGGGGGAPSNYSTTEQNTGARWVDGKSIYRITFDRHENPVAHGATVADISALNVETLISAETSISYSSGLVTGGTGGRGVFTIGDDLVYYGGGQTGSLTYCTIWYTKTS